MSFNGVACLRELVTLVDWEAAMGEEVALVLVSRRDCDECVTAVKSETELGVGHLCIVDLDNPDGFRLRSELSWISKEVDVVPFWRLFLRGEDVGSVRGLNTDAVASMVRGNALSHSLGDTDTQKPEA